MKFVYYLNLYGSGPDQIGSKPNLHLFFIFIFVYKMTTKLSFKDFIEIYEDDVIDLYPDNIEFFEDFKGMAYTEGC